MKAKRLTYLIMALLFAISAKAQLVVSNPMEWLALAEGNEMINREIDKQIEGRPRRQPGRQPSPQR